MAHPPTLQTSSQALHGFKTEPSAGDDWLGFDDKDLESEGSDGFLYAARLVDGATWKKMLSERGKSF